MTTQVTEFRGYDYQLPQYKELLARVRGEVGDGEKTPVSSLQWRGVASGYNPPPLVGWGHPLQLHGPGIVGRLYHLLGQAYDRDIRPAFRFFRDPVGVEFKIVITPSLHVVLSSSAGVRRLFAVSWRPSVNGNPPAHPTAAPRLLEAMHYQIARDQE
ncbi:MAG: hypothetical protein AAB671_00145 [Patescibacteria group bacterium]